jgi:hypothetical protein
LATTDFQSVGCELRRAAISVAFVGQDRLELSANGLRERERSASLAQGREVARIAIDEKERGEPSRGNRGGDAAPDVDVVEVALAEALTRAAAAEQWTTVEVLSRELTARREARAAVVDLGVERTKRERGQ